MRALALSACVFLAGCECSLPPSISDAGSDAGGDAGKPDAGRDDERDAGETDAGRDAGAPCDGPGWRFESVDTEGDVGDHSAIAIGPDGAPAIAYRDGDARVLKYAARSAAGVWSIETPPGSESDIGVAMAIDAEGVVHVVHRICRSARSCGVEYLRRAGTWSAEDIDVPEDSISGSFPSIALGGGAVHAAYYHTSEGDLRYARRGAVGWTSDLVDATRYTGQFTSIGVDAAGTVHIAYHDPIDEFDLEHASLSGGAWDLSTIDAEGYTGADTSMVVDQANGVHISYVDYTLCRVLHAHLPAGGDPVITRVAEVVRSGGVCYADDTSIAIDPDGRLHVVFTDTDVRHAVREGDVWTTEIIEPVRGADDTETSFAIASDGSLHVSYYDAGRGDLLYAYTCPD
jgi:hypothetical protein